jgi:phosphate transport system permease protein
LRAFEQAARAFRTPDQRYLFCTHELLGSTGSPVTAITSANGTRAIAVGNRDGRIDLIQVTTETSMAQMALQAGQPVQALSIPAKDNGFYAASGHSVQRWAVDMRYPEATLSSLFMPVWYEGNPGPAHQWQSSGADDSIEMKLGLVPLIFGTLKATFYAMIFGTPLALLAAIYTSEFLHPSVKARIKPTIELMASLPSVVLGFLAGLIWSQFAQDWIAAVLTSVMVIPFTVLLGAYLWQMLPYGLLIRIREYRLIATGASLVVGVAVSWLIYPAVENLLFAGDIQAWLNQDATTAAPGSGFGGWIYLMLPISAVIAAVIVMGQVNPRLRQRSRQWDRPTAAWVELAKFLAGSVGALGLAVSLAWLLTSWGVDPRGGVQHWELFHIKWNPMDTFIQRNSLIIGFAMGFAIIPIIYTISEDALSSVPEHLRAASLGCGATPWQTATRVILPVAVSGLFSALMIGLGRAVGETMIVLMAYGSTPIMEMNVFNGARTLSANIATEMPEAPKGETLYRTLFLNGLVLFVMTFLLNTLAEMIRLRFRKKSKAL